MEPLERASSNPDRWFPGGNPDLGHRLGAHGGGERKDHQAHQPYSDWVGRVRAQLLTSRWEWLGLCPTVSCFFSALHPSLSAYPWERTGVAPGPGPKKPEPRYSYQRNHGVERGPRHTRPSPWALHFHVYVRSGRNFSHSRIHHLKTAHPRFLPLVLRASVVIIKSLIHWLEFILVHSIGKETNLIFFINS